MRELATGVTPVPCSVCGGDGYALALSGARHRLFGSELPSEEVVVCSACSGSGELEVCAACLEPPRIRGGLEVCGCAALELRRAA